MGPPTGVCPGVSRGDIGPVGPQYRGPRATGWSSWLPPSLGNALRPTPEPQDPLLRALLEEEIYKLLQKKAVVPFEGQDFFMSTFFLAPKKGVLSWT